MEGGEGVGDRREEQPWGARQFAFNNIWTKRQTLPLFNTNAEAASIAAKCLVMPAYMKPLLAVCSVVCAMFMLALAIPSSITAGEGSTFALGNYLSHNSSMNM